MLYLYPSNRLEDLATLLAEVVKTRPRNILSPIDVLVPNPGMQHWLNMQLCDHVGIAMNINCPMPTRYIWDLCRTLLGDENIPQQSPYKREVLAWKIYQLCQSSQCKEASFYPQLSQYWAQASSELEQQRRIFSFSRQLADLFEQYLVFRPDWLKQWEKGVAVECSSPRYQGFEDWQRWFWLELIKWMPAHPVSLQFEALDALATRKHALPNDIYIFSINSISPIYLTFFDAISQHTNVHLFTLNPSVNYWGDARSDIALAKLQRRQAMTVSLDESSVHPLLRNLGAQGRDLNNLLTDMQHQEIAAFDIAPDYQHEDGLGTSCLLAQIQLDILSGSTHKQAIANNNSIAVHACHNEVRELQVLKDVLLAKFAQTPNLQPKDVLVMCPSIEAYSPYIRSVFTQSSQFTQNLPISISDRQPIESQSYIVAFMQLLLLPSTRFDATSIIDLISLPALARKYELSASDIDTCAAWIKDAAIDWGKDEVHLGQHIGPGVNDETHTWHWGVSRLLVGMISAANATLVDGYSPINYIEGQSTVVLGRFLQALESLESVVTLLSATQNIAQWTQTLLRIVDEHMRAGDDDSFAQSLLTEAIYSLEKNANVAQFDDAIELAIVHEALSTTLSIPEVRSQFYSGNITFCSMLPMRSIPFKVIAILGLNQSEFPRQDKPVEIDLMQDAGARLGDRSRRGDDRYLFLESLISARQYLHLSFQYRHIKNNSEREPSLVIKMLIDYCHQHYTTDSLSVTQHALHPFSAKTFMSANGYEGSFDEGWFTCLRNVQEYEQNQSVQKSSQSTRVQPASIFSTIKVQELVSFFKGTLQYHAKKVLNVYLEKPSTRDFSPSYSIDGLTQYSVRSDVTLLLNENRHLRKRGPEPYSVKNEAGVNNTSTAKNAFTAKWLALRETWLRSGKLPFLVGLENDLDEAFLSSVALASSFGNNDHKRRAKGQLSVNKTTIEYDFQYDLKAGITLSKLTPKAPSLRHFIEPWIQYLLLLIHIQTDEAFNAFQAANSATQEGDEQNAVFDSKTIGDDTMGFGVHIHYIDPKVKPQSSEHGQISKQVNVCHLSLADNVSPNDALSKLLTIFEKGCHAPLLIDLALAEEVVKYTCAQDALESKGLMAKWASVHQKNENGFDLFPSTYFDFLLGSVPEFTLANIQYYFDCFQAILQREGASITVDLHDIDISVLSTGENMLNKDAT